MHRLSIEQLISMDKPTFYRQASRTYPLAWALTHYLMEQDPRRYPNGAVQKYIRDLQRGRDPVACFWTRFGRDREKLNRLFAAYVMRLQP